MSKQFYEYVQYTGENGANEELKAPSNFVFQECDGWWGFRVTEVLLQLTIILKYPMFCKLPQTMKQNKKKNKKEEPYTVKLLW